MAAFAYTSFCQIIGQETMRRAVVNSELIERLMYAHLTSDEPRSPASEPEPVAAAALAADEDDAGAGPRRAQLGPDADDEGADGDADDDSDGHGHDDLDDDIVRSINESAAGGDSELDTLRGLDDFELVDAGDETSGRRRTTSMADSDRGEAVAPTTDNDASDAEEPSSSFNESTMRSPSSSGMLSSAASSAQLAASSPGRGSPGGGGSGRGTGSSSGGPEVARRPSADALRRAGPESPAPTSTAARLSNVAKTSSKGSKSTAVLDARPYVVPVAVARPGVGPFAS